ncbi:hypothetical protein JHK87_041521 [Glycine soja]|nr:hypothetical protein JHK87_041521 [Glycine soja]
MSHADDVPRWNSAASLGHFSAFYSHEKKRTCQKETYKCCFIEKLGLEAPMASKRNTVVFEDYFPAMMEKLGTEGFMKELTNGFQLLMDREKKVITFESLKKNSALLGLEGMSDDELRCMLREGDLDGDDALDEMEFCTLMFRLSPALMNNSKELLEEAIYPFH